MLNKTQNNTELAIILFEKLFAQLPLQIKQLNLAIEQHDLNSAYQISHKLHGSVGFCGFTNMEKHAALLDTSLLNENLVGTSIHLEDLAFEIDHLLSIKTHIMAELNT